MFEKIQYWEIRVQTCTTGHNGGKALHVLFSWRTRVITWLVPWAGKMNQILRCDWLPELARWSYLAHSGYGLCPARKMYLYFGVLSKIINPLNQPSLFGQDGWILALFIFCVCVDLDIVSKKPVSSHLDWTSLDNQREVITCTHRKPCKFALWVTDGRKVNMQVRIDRNEEEAGNGFKERGWWR